MEDEPVSFEVATLAKSKGFDLPTNAFYAKQNGQRYVSKDKEKKENFNDEFQFGSVRISCVTQTTMSRWLRDVHKMHLTVDKARDIEGYFFDIYDTKMGIKLLAGWIIDQNYESVVNFGLVEAIKNIK
jgi:hypothetical protein